MPANRPRSHSSEDSRSRSDSPSSSLGKQKSLRRRRSTSLPNRHAKVSRPRCFCHLRGCYNKGLGTVQSRSTVWRHLKDNRRRSQAYVSSNSGSASEGRRRTSVAIAAQLLPDAALRAVHLLNVPLKKIFAIYRKSFMNPIMRRMTRVLVRKHLATILQMSLHL